MLTVFFQLYACKTEIIKPIAAFQKIEILQVRDNKIALSYALSDYGYIETGVKYYPKDKPSEVLTVKAIRNNGLFYVELYHLAPSTTYVLQPYYIMDANLQLSQDLKEITTTSKFPEDFSISWINEEIKYSDFGEFQINFEGEGLQNVNLKDLTFYLNDTELSKSYPVKQANGKYKIAVYGRFLKGYDTKEMIIVALKDKEIVRGFIDFKYDGERLKMELKRTNIISRYFVSVNDQFYNFDNNKVSTFNEANNGFIEIADIPYYVGTLARSSIVIGNKVFFKNQITSHITPNEYNDGNEIYSQSFDLTKKEFKVYYYGKHNWSTDHNYEHGTMFMHEGFLYQAYTIYDFVNGMPTMPVPQVKNYVARYNPKTDSFEDYNTFSNSLSKFSFISFQGQLYAFALKDVVVQEYVVGKTLTFYKVNPSNFQFEEILQIGDEYSPFSYAPEQIMEYQGKLLLSFNLNYHTLFDVTTNTSQQIFMKTPISNMNFHDILKHKGKHYLFTTGSVYEITIN